MALPIKINAPKYAINIPSTNQKIQFRPFLVGEQKNMLLVLETKDNDNIIAAIKELITACTDGLVDVEKLTSFDLEFIFLQIRARSVGESIGLTAECNNRDCRKQIRFAMDVTQATINIDESPDKKIPLDDDIGVVMRYPSLNEVVYLREHKDDESVLFDVVASCIDSVWDSSDLISTSEYEKTEVVDFVNSLTVKQLNKLIDFIVLVPAVEMHQQVQCPHCDNVMDIKIEGLENFFA